MTTIANKLGGGVYAMTEVSRLTGLAPSTATSWFKGRSDAEGRGPVFTSDYPPIGGDFAVSFLDLIDALVAGQFRREGVSMAIIRRAHEKLKDELGTIHPFAHQSLFTDGRAVIRKTGAPALIEVVSNQLWFLEFENSLKRIDYQDDTQLAYRWHIAEGVIVDPKIHFGKPVIENTAISTRVLARLYMANQEDAGLVAHLFRISESDVEHAVTFEERHGYLKVA